VGHAALPYERGERPPGGRGGKTDHGEGGGDEGVLDRRRTDRGGHGQPRRPERGGGTVDVEYTARKLSSI